MNDVAQRNDELAQLAVAALDAEGGWMTQQMLEARILPSVPETLFRELRELVRDGILWFEGVAGPGRIWILLPDCSTRRGLHRALKGLDAEAMRGIAAVLDRHTIACTACASLPHAMAWAEGRVPA